MPGNRSQFFAHKKGVDSTVTAVIPGVQASRRQARRRSVRSGWQHPSSAQRHPHPPRRQCGHKGQRRYSLFALKDGKVKFEVWVRIASRSPSWRSPSNNRV